MFDLKLDERGQVEFNGRGHTRQQGWGVKRVAPEIAVELLGAIEAAGYWDLRETYRAAGDGCSEVEQGRETYIWNVTTTGPAKIVIDYQGCRGIQKLEQLRKLPDMLIDKLMLQSWLGQ